MLDVDANAWTERTEEQDGAGVASSRGRARRAEAWESLFRAQVALMRRFQRDDVWGALSIREYDVMFTLSRCRAGPPGSRSSVRVRC